MRVYSKLYYEKYIIMNLKVNVIEMKIEELIINWNKCNS